MKKRKLMLIIISILLLISVFVGKTIAYFSDIKEDNAKICVGNVDISLTEHEILYINDLNKWSLGSKVVLKNNYNNISPATLLPKDPTVKNIGDEPEYVAFSYRVIKEDFENLFLNYTPEKIFSNLDTSNWTVNVKSVNNNVIIYFALNNILWPGENATPFKGIKISKDFKYIAGHDSFDLNQTAYAVQARGFAKNIDIYNEIERDNALKQCIRNWGK